MKTSTLASSFALMFFLMATSSRLFAQEKEEFNISIADKTEEPGILEKNETQIEAGYLRNYYEKGAPSSIIQGLIRYGVSSKLEIRLLTEEGKGRDRYMEETVQSTYPLAAGFKWKLLEKHKWLPDMSLVGYLHLPFTARNKAQTLYWSPLLYMAFEHKLSDKWTLDYNAGAQQEAYGNSWASILNGSIHYKLTDDLETFGEYYAQYEPLELPQHNLGAGFSYHALSWLGFYISGGTTIFYADKNYFFTGGAAVKFH